MSPDAADALEVTDHAVVRWLERVMGVDLEAYRVEIRDAFRAGAASVHFTEAAIYIDVPAHGVHLVVRNGVITTVIPSDFEGGDE